MMKKLSRTAPRHNAAAGNRTMHTIRTVLDSWKMSRYVSRQRNIYIL